MKQTEKIRNMFLLQNKLNNYTNGEDWCSGKTKENKIINWERAIYLEAAEAIDSFPWKHWKSITQQPDIKNARIELVDIWHFLMSSIIETQTIILKNKYTKKIEKIFELNEEENKIGINLNFKYINEVFNSFNETHQIYKEYSETWNKETHNRINNILQLTEETMLASLILNKFKLQYNEEPTIEILEQIQELTDKLLQTFIGTCATYNLNFEELYSLYIGKNVLNQFRQNHGYKEGTYIKIWNEKEDNVIMQEELLKLSENLSYDSLYNNLENIYKKLT